MPKRKKRKDARENRRKRKNNTPRKTKLVYLLVFLLIILIAAACFYLFYSNRDEYPKVIKETISVNGRQFIFSKKADVKNAPVIIVLHGGTQSAETWFEDGPQGDFAKLAIDRGYAVIAPDSLSPLCEGVKQWDFRKNSSDMEFFDNIFNWIWLREDLDSNRIYVTGISFGGFMTSRLAHHYGSKIDAIAVHSAGDANNAYVSPGSCYLQYNYTLPYIEPTHPRTMLIHGTNDTIVPYDLSINYFYSLKNAGVGVVLFPEQGEDHYWYEKYNEVILNWFN